MVDVQCVVLAGFALLAALIAFALWDGARHEKRVDAALGHLLMFGESYGRDMADFSRGALKRGTVYVLLGQLEDQGLVSSRSESLAMVGYRGIPRRVYKLTARGRREALARAGAPPGVEVRR